VDNAARAARRADNLDETIIFYHGTVEAHTAGFGPGKNIIATGEEGIQDFGKAFYAFSQEQDAINWAKSRAISPHNRPYVVAIEVEKTKLQELVGKESNPFEYFWGTSFEDYRKGVCKTQEEIDAFRQSADYFNGPISSPSYGGYQGQIQYAFKTQQALDLLSASPRRIYQVFQ
jgi:hypothetical protein